MSYKVFSKLTIGFLLGIAPKRNKKASGLLAFFDPFTKEVDYNKTWKDLYNYCKALLESSKRARRSDLNKHLAVYKKSCN